MNKSSSPLLHLHLLHFFDNEQIFIFQKKKKKTKFSKKALGLGALGSYFLGFFQKKKKKKFKIFNSFRKNSVFPNFFSKNNNKKKIKKK